VAAARAAWRVWQASLNPADLVFLDETGASTNMARRTGWASRGERLVSAVPHGHWKTTTFVAALRQDGLVAPLVIDGPMNGATFLAYIRHVLVPTLRPGQIVMLDNLSSHKVAGVRQAVEATGAALVPLPAYSPDLNPIEQAFAKLKNRLRRMARRTIEGLWNGIGQALEDFTPAECANYIANSGYRQSS
jgi:transposase